MLNTTETVKRQATADYEIAIVGISGKFSGSRDVNQFWEGLIHEQSSLQELPPERPELFRLAQEDMKHIRYGGFIPDVDQFDPLFFRISPKEAEHMDPRQRLFLEESWKAVEDAGYSLQELSGTKCGVFVGIQQGEYLERFRDEANEQVPTGNSLSVIPARISYLLNLKGPSVALDTACSSSLVALSLACDSLINGSSEMAIAGGIQIMLTPSIYLSLGKLGMLNADGICKPFADGADGIGLGEGVGVAVLKKYSSAIRDGDHIYGVIKGIGVNQDGKTNGITAPSGLAQASLERGIYEKYGIDPAEITYVEAHGTGTRLGDPIEVGALTEAFGPFTAKKQYCHLGSIKGNIGHTLSASGMASLFKVLLSLKHGKIPATLHCSSLNPLIDFKNSPFYVGNRTEDWHRLDGRPRMAAVSSFGMSGTNCHMVIAEHMELGAGERPAGEMKPLLFALSAKSDRALEIQARRLLVYLRQQGAVESIEDISFTLLAGRDHYDYRSMFVADSRIELIRELEAFLERRPSPGWYRGEGGSGNKRVNSELKVKINGLLKQLREGILGAVDRDKALNIISNYYIKGFEADFKVMFAPVDRRRVSLPTYPFEYIRCWIEEQELGGTATTSLKGGESHPLLHRNVSTIEGIRFISETLSGHPNFIYKTVFNQRMVSEAILLEIAAKATELGGGGSTDLLKDIQFTHPLKAGSEEQRLCVELQGAEDSFRFGIFYEETGRRIVAAGSSVTEIVTKKVEASGFNIRSFKAGAAQILTSQQFYSALADQGLEYDEQAQIAEKLYSSLSGYLVAVTPSACCREGYVIPPLLTEAILQVTNLDIMRMGGTLSTVYALGEIRLIGDLEDGRYIHLTGSGNSYDARVLNEEGEAVLIINRLRMAPLATDNLSHGGDYVLLKKEWRQAEHQPQPQPARPDGRFIIIVNDEMNEEALAEIYASFDTVLVIGGGGLRDSQDGFLTADFWEEGGSDAAIETILGLKTHIRAVIDFSDLHSEPHHRSKQNYGKIKLLQALVKKHARGLCILHLTSGLQGVNGRTETLAGAEIAAIIRTIRAEYKEVRAQTVDIGRSSSSLVQDAINTVYAELSIDSAEAELSYNDGIRFKPVFASLKQANKWASRNMEGEGGITLDPGKFYVVTGGTRGIGAEVVRLLARRGVRKLVLMGVQPLPSRTNWDEILTSDMASSGIQSRVKRILELEAAGVDVKFYSGSLTDKARLSPFFAEIRRQWGEIGGVIHCAGSNLNNHPAFINKKIGDIRQVFEPKVEGLEMLGDLFADDRLDFFVAFSSISAALPVLSAGLSDYSAANCYSDLYIRHQQELGRKHFQSIIWPSWSEVGMLADTGFPLSSLYTGAGFTAHSLADGLFMLEDAMSGKEPSVMPAIVSSEAFDPGAILRPGPVTKVDTEKHVPENRSRVHTNDGEFPPNAIKRATAQIMHIFGEELKLPKDRLREDLPFAEIGVDSILLIEVIKKLDDAFHTRIDPALFFELRDMKALAEHLLVGGNAEFQEEAREPGRSREDDGLKLADGFDRVPEYGTNCTEKRRKASGPTDKDSRIAVIGIGCHFPGAPDKDTFWNNLKQGVDSITEVPCSRWNAEELYSPVPTEGKSISKWGGFIEDIELFDNEYFEIKENPEQISPLMRQCLEVTAEVFLDAGYEKSEISGRKVGIFIGAHPGSYPNWVQDFNKNTIIGIGQNFIASYASHYFNLKGPSLTVDSACSSSLMSLHLACQSIRTGESEMAVAGGVDLILDERPYLVFSASKAMSPDGKCHTFDVDANGIVPGEGCGVVLLKALDKALADGDRIYTVIEATAANNDGRTMGVTTPSKQAQEEVIADAITRAGIDPRTIGYVETHGTGTMIGDPIELKALTTVYKTYTDDIGFCGVGSVKTNIGHCLSAAGIASFIKASLCVYYKILVPTLNCSKPNPRFDFENSPFYPVLETTAWRKHGDARRAAISSFGFGGTNVHAIIGECTEGLLCGYSERRKPLPATRFQRARAWVDGRKAACNPSGADQDQLSFLQFVEE
ncbi:beta-ketoacyl synthase N-terminal-like domain-containing protein [Paenibacillus lutimineralis]|uniref:KR domain-containing protein n=1 Tax=Paenibacillus lutimineralis TaxID=2707005 RepID=A0A3Q9IAZ9_9BACL|nr:beta-ketoacyl synthase N-terminal-like domain-containing protein [Paenibacillus lutimineralis]AZS14155.1 KR domain-containing protein [Paenibacillus lutimineralis]